MDAPLWSPGAVVERFYASVRAGDVDGVLALVDDEFASNVALHEPESLPYGGLYEGRDLVKQVFAGLGSPRSPIVASQLRLEELYVCGGAADRSAEVFASLTFPWAPFNDDARRAHALERWSFREAKVERIAAYLWDTAACIEALASEP